jgi:ABC-2 type transport system ATP-binding protein
LGGFSMLFEPNAQQRESLAQLGQLTTPSLSELFVAKIKPQHLAKEVA